MFGRYSRAQQYMEKALKRRYQIRTKDAERKVVLLGATPRQKKLISLTKPQGGSHVIDRTNNQNSAGNFRVNKSEINQIDRTNKPVVAESAAEKAENKQVVVSKRKSLGFINLSRETEPCIVERMNDSAETNNLSEYESDYRLERPRKTARLETQQLGVKPTPTSNMFGLLESDETDNSVPGPSGYVGVKAPPKPQTTTRQNSQNAQKKKKISLENCKSLHARR